MNNDNFEEWDFRRRERIRNIPDWEEEEYYHHKDPITFTDLIQLLILVMFIVSFWGAIVWSIVHYG